MGEEERAVGRDRWDLLLLVLLGSHLIWVFSHFLPIVVGPDAGGLLVQARLLATELTTGFRPESPLQFLGSHWMQTGDGDFYSRYPPGFPLLLALARVLGGPRAPFFLNPLLATGVVALTYLVGRRWLGRGMAFAAALFVATLPILNRLSLHGDAHVAAAALLLLGVWLLFRWEAEPSAVRAFWAGLAFGILPSVRYPEAVAMGPAAVFFLIHRRKAGGWRGFLPAALGAGLPLVLLGLYNASVYGAPWRTGYGFTHEQWAFGLRNLSANVPTYLGAFLAGGMGIFFLLGLVGLAWMCLRPDSRPKGILLLGTVASLALLYGAYYWGGLEEASLLLRYFLALLPLLVLGTLWLARALPWRRLSLGFLSLMGLLYLGWALPESSRSLLEEWLGLARGQAVLEVLSEEVPPGSILIGRREIQDVLDYFGRWRLVDDRLIPGSPSRERTTLVWEMTAEERSRWVGVPTPVQVTKAVEARGRYAGLDDEELASLILDDLEAWAGPDHGIFWLARPEALESFRDLAGERVQPVSLTEVALPVRGRGLRLPSWVPIGPLHLYRLEMSVSTPESKETS